MFWISSKFIGRSFSFKIKVTANSAIAFLGNRLYLLNINQNIEYQSQLFFFVGYF